MTRHLLHKKYGLHRVLTPIGSLPQAAFKLDASLPIQDNEILVSLRHLQIDSASFRDLKVRAENEGGNVQENIAIEVKRIVEERGKMHNPRTNSGGVLMGTVREIGAKHPLATNLQVGDEIISLVSLTLTPLTLIKILEVDLLQERIDVEGHAILAESSMAASVPNDLPRGVVLAAYDICGAPAQIKRHVKAGENILIIGLGKAGRSMAAMADISGANVWGLDPNAQAVDWCHKNLRGHFAKLSAKNPLEVMEWLSHETSGRMADQVFNAANVEGTEMTAIMSAKPGGSVMFFGMNTSFQRSVLGAEGIGQDVQLLMGNGFVPGHDKLMLDLLRDTPALLGWFEENFA